jgi:murein DD-endopeptidase MepM/ murein hydrolase activator NlpD
MASGAANSLSLEPLIGAEKQSQPLAGSMRPYYRASSLGRIARQAQPHTSIPPRPRLEIVTYTVQPGDTAESIAQAFGLEPTTLMWSNPAMEKTPDLLKNGQELVILPVDGVYHAVTEGDTVESLAEKYSASAAEIRTCPFNTLTDDGELKPGTKVIIPGGTKPYEKREVVLYEGPMPEGAVGEANFSWPAGGYLSQGYWYGHRAIDVANATGIAIVAADAGYVVFAGWTDVGYGYLVVVDHGNGFQTYYAHLSNLYVYEGQAVERGDVIGAMGSTGYSTGPHLHFEIRYNSYPTNPLIYLP